MRNYLVYTGFTESQKYTFIANDIQHLKKQIESAWHKHAYPKQWYKRKDIKGLPKGSLRFNLKEEYGCLGLLNNYYLIIPDED